MARRKKTNEDEPKDNPENVNESDDNFGLPEIEYEPIDRSAVSEETTVEESSEISSDEIVNSNTEYEAESVVEESHNHDDHIFNPTEETSIAPKVIGILIVLLLAGGAAWYFMFYQPKKRAEEKARQEQIAQEQARKEEEEKRLADLKRQEDEKRRADSLANAAPKTGTIETLSERTGRYYVVVASDIDDDLIMDFAKKLSLKGINSTIIPPHRNVKFFRIAVASGDTYSDAQATADGLKNEYQGGAWVTKY